jgi:hypothetical protein
VTDFTHQNLAGSRFEDVSLRGAVFRGVDLRDVKVRGAWLNNVDVDGEVDVFRVNGVDVVPYVEAELDRRYPDRVKMHPADAAGFREAWAALERLWGETIARARTLDPALLHERVDGEWSVIENLRHLVFATDSWVLRAILGDPAPYHPLDLLDDTPGVPRDRDARPSLDEVLAVRAERMASVRDLLAGLTDERLDGMTTPVPEPGYPESIAFPVRRVLLSVLNEEWLHRLYVEAELDVLTGG